MISILQRQTGTWSVTREGNFREILFPPECFQSAIAFTAPAPRRHQTWRHICEEICRSRRRGQQTAERRVARLQSHHWRGNAAASGCAIAVLLASGNVSSGRNADWRADDSAAEQLRHRWRAYTSRCVLRRSVPSNRLLSHREYPGKHCLRPPFHRKKSGQAKTWLTHSPTSNDSSLSIHSAIALVTGPMPPIFSVSQSERRATSLRPIPRKGLMPPPGETDRAPA